MNTFLSILFWFFAVSGMIVWALGLGSVALYALIRIIARAELRRRAKAAPLTPSETQ